MLSGRSFVLALALGSALGWSTADAANKFKIIEEKIIRAIGGSEAAAKVFQDLEKNPHALAALRALKQKLYHATETTNRIRPIRDSASTTQKLENLSARERGTLIVRDDELGLSKSYLEHAGLDPKRYEIKNGKLYLREPISFDLPGGGSFKLDEIDLWKPTLSGACALSEDCKKFVRGVMDKVAPGANDQNAE
jgi:hypothetical protein